MGSWPRAATRIAPTITATTTAMTGLAIGRRSAFSDNRDLGAASASADMGQSSRCAVMAGLVQPAHEAANFLDVGGFRLQVGDDAAAIDDQDAVGEAENLVEIGRDDKDAAAGVAHGDQRAMDR